MSLSYYNENDKKTAAWLRELIRAGLIADGEVDDRSIEEVTAKDVMGYVQCHWFAGIGGWSYALRLAGWPDDRPVWTGSCPCQPFSVAGKRKGTEDKRHLWPVFARLIRECKPITVFGEQVASSDGRRWLSGVFAGLEQMGYQRAGADLPAACVGEEASIIDEDSVCLGCGKNWDYCECVLPGPFSGEEKIVIGAPHIGQRIYWVASSNMSGRQWEGQAQSAWRRDHIINPWSFQASRGADGCIRRVDSRPYGLGYGIPERVAFNSGYGNAIVPQVAATFIRAFMDSNLQINLHQNDITGKKAIANDN